jgi:hypothetical protein
MTDPDNTKTDTLACNACGADVPEQCLCALATPPNDPTEILSEAAHDAWMESKHAQGITSRASEWGEELMAPYSALSERAKDLDRGTVRGVLNAVKRAGFEVRAALAAHDQQGDPTCDAGICKRPAGHDGPHREHSPWPVPPVPLDDDEFEEIAEKVPGSVPATPEGGELEDLLARADQIVDRWDKGRAGYSRNDAVFARSVVADLASALRHQRDETERWKADAKQYAAKAERWKDRAEALERVLAEARDTRLSFKDEVAESIWQRHADGWRAVMHEIIEPPCWNRSSPDATEPLTAEQVAWLKGEPVLRGSAEGDSK